MATGPSYNRFSAIAIGGPNTNTIPTDLGFSASLDVSGNVLFKNDLRVLGTLTYAGAEIAYTDLLVSNDANIGNQLGVTGPTELYSTLNVGGTGTFNGPVEINNNLNILNDLGVTGNTQLTNLTTSGTCNINGTLGVTGNTQLTNLTTSGNTNINGILGVTGDTQLTNLTASGNTNINGTLGVTGITTLHNTLNAKQTNIIGNLGVTGSSTFNGANFTSTTSGDTSFQTTSTGSIYFQPQGSGNVVFGTVAGDVTMDAYNEANFKTQVGSLNFATMVSGDINFNPASTYDINLTTTGVNGAITAYSRQNTTIKTDYGDVDIKTLLNGDILLTAANNRLITLTTSGLGDITLNSGENVTVKATTGTCFISGPTGIYCGDQLYFNRTPASTEYTTNNKALGYTNSINTGTSYTGTASDTTTPAQVGTFQIPTRGVWLIQFDCELTLNTGSDTITNREIVLSETSASLTPCAPAFHMRDPIDDAAGGSGTRQVYSFCGVYHLTASGTKDLYINVIAQTSGSRTVTASGEWKYTRIA
jgi:hypothetical protein